MRSADGETGYDYLVIAPGSRALPLPQQNGVRVHYPKALRHLRQLGALIEGLAERARQDQTGVHRIAVVGGGLSGVEFAMAIRESADRACRTAGVARGRIGVVLCERAARLHPAGPAGLSRRLDRELTRYGIDVLVDHEILEAAHGRLLTMDGVIPADTVVCCIGSQPNLRIELTGLTWADDGLVVDAALRCAGHTTVFAIGDGMLFRQQGRARPDLRQAHRAASQGRHTARNIVRLIDGKAAKPYRPRETPIGVMLQSHRGVFSYLGRSTAGVIAGHAKRWLEVRHT